MGFYLSPGSCSVLCTWNSINTGGSREVSWQRIALTSLASFPTSQDAHFCHSAWLLSAEALADICEFRVMPCNRALVMGEGPKS